MGFLQDRGAAIQAAVDQGDAETAAALLVHALIEGPGTLNQNLDEMTNIVNEANGNS